MLSHAEEKLRELRTHNLPFISTTVSPSICTADTFVVERQQLIRGGIESLRINADLVDQTQITDWVSSNDVLVPRLDQKALAIRQGEPVTARQLRDETVRHYLEGQNALAKLRSDYPEIFEAVDRIKKDTEHFLAVESLTTSALPPEHWKVTRDLLQTELTKALSSISSFTVRQLVHEAIADWLIRCPLDFPAVPTNGHSTSQP